MTPLEDFSSWLVYELLRLAKGSELAAALDYFVYDTVKVFLLLIAVVFLVGIIRTFVTPERVKKILGGRREGVGNVLAALLGVPTPFCSCSAVPLFIGFVESGVPLGVTFSFLIASPLINEIAIALLFGLFGWKIAALYVASGLFIAVVAGIIIGRLRLEKEVEPFVYNRGTANEKQCACQCSCGKNKKKKKREPTWKTRFDFAVGEVRDIVWRVAPYIVLGIAIGAAIHGFAPVDFLANVAGANNPLAVPLVVLVGVPLYSNAAGTIPIVQALLAKGMALGTALAFMMSVTALSLPEMIILRRILKPKLIAVFAGTLFIAFVLTGWLFNALIG